MKARPIEAITPADIVDAAITASRFAKAVRMANILEDEGINGTSVLHMTEMAWLIVTKIARYEHSSAATRVLTMKLLRDRDSVRELLKSNGWKGEQS